MKNILIITMLLLSQLGYSQRSDDSIANDLSRLAGCKYRYEKFTSRAKSKPSDFLTKSKEAYNAYVNLANKIKDNPKIYLSYIERQLKEPELIEDQTLVYSYFQAVGLMVNVEYHYISRRDLYLVIKYSLFERDMDLLPEKLDGIPLMDRPKDISPHAELQTIEEAKRGLPAGSLK